ncbi:hypothetical protein VTL71DRAFT_15130, partial [Oculimacula yallundae]
MASESASVCWSLIRFWFTKIKANQDSSLVNVYQSLARRQLDAPLDIHDSCDYSIAISQSNNLILVLIKYRQTRPNLFPSQ